MLKRVRQVMLAAILGLGVASPAWADWQDGADAYIRGDYEAAFRILKPLAEQGHADALNSLGLLYFNGLGVEQDFAEGLRLYYEAAKQGYAKAQFNLGQAYEVGQGVTQDFALAYQWYRLAAENGLVYAQSSLGRFYARGAGVEQSFPDAYLWFEIAVRRSPPGNDRTNAERARELVARYLPLETIEQLNAQAAAWQPPSGN